MRVVFLTVKYLDRKDMVSVRSQVSEQNALNRTAGEKKIWFWITTTITITTTTIIIVKISHKHCYYGYYNKAVGRIAYHNSLDKMSGPFAGRETRCKVMKNCSSIQSIAPFWLLVCFGCLWPNQGSSVLSNWGFLFMLIRCFLLGWDHLVPALFLFENAVSQSQA